MVRVDLGLEPGRKRQIWQDAIAWHFGEADLSIRRPDRFTGRIVALGDGPIRLVEVESDNELGVRTRRHAAHQRDEVFVVALVNRGRVAFEQRGRSCLLTDGMATLFAASEPYEIRHDDPADVINLTAPASLLEAFLRRPHDHVCRAVAMRGLVGRVSRDLLVGLAGTARTGGPMAADGASLSPASLRLALASIAVLLEEGAEAQPGLSPRQAAMMRRCREIIAASAGDPDLGPTQLAQRMGVSVRCLHGLFHAAGTTVCDGVLEARLERSLQALGNPGLAHLRLKEIAFASGFANPSVFAAQFKRRYGKTPGEMRRDLLAAR
ncbi:helix-turn-helix domain-containing protein [Rhodoplanes sp. TEM]|uniref:Helix-turn-helix domain-containing protein n=1 Tax=Rhodoplanes tepidamans TaxID=200616 RepID=A0ABT5J4X8_RHOTP|nr:MULTISPECIES: helix-turn-helix domain-containing protein [Rhodoplanes]MDC7784461.1 helix-turn-helix domain-containing protein [Rhodoplanes tepidamans]MDC7983491.1 helix-turn-helix domain-containing protein [Rhodoplanes sp. TEM]MDQ0356968.1 AraC-like DNA-binding protein [Rhodoplanes tepidamans]